MSVSIHFEPYFVEEAVFLRIKQIESLGQKEAVRLYHEKRTCLYETVLKKDQSSAFHEFYLTLFRELGIEKNLSDVFEEFPFLNVPNLSVLIKSTFRKDQERAELFVNESSPSLVVSLRISHVLNPPFLQRFLRHELLHISDVIDPEFQYDPKPVLGGVGQVEEELIRDRFRVLWDMYVTVRLIHRGSEPFIPLDELKRQFEKSFSHFDDERKADVINGFLKRKNWTQQKLIELAQNERFNKTLGEGGLRCPLCHFTSYEKKRVWRDQDKGIMAEIKKDFDGWRPLQGACSQCYELYESRCGAAT